MDWLAFPCLLFFYFTFHCTITFLCTETYLHFANPQNPHLLIRKQMDFERFAQLLNQSLVCGSPWRWLSNLYNIIWLSFPFLTYYSYSFLPSIIHLFLSFILSIHWIIHCLLVCLLACFWFPFALLSVPRFENPDYCAEPITIPHGDAWAHHDLLTNHTTAHEPERRDI